MTPKYQIQNILNMKFNKKLISANSENIQTMIVYIRLNNYFFFSCRILNGHGHVGRQTSFKGATRQRPKTAIGSLDRRRERFDEQ